MNIMNQWLLGKCEQLYTYMCLLIICRDRFYPCINPVFLTFSNIMKNPDKILNTVTLSTYIYIIHLKVALVFFHAGFCHWHLYMIYVSLFLMKVALRFCYQYWATGLCFLSRLFIKILSAILYRQFRLAFRKLYSYSNI